MRSTGCFQYYYDYSPCHLDTRDRRIQIIRVSGLYSVELSDKLYCFSCKANPSLCTPYLQVVRPRHSVQEIFRSPWNKPRLVFERRGGRRRRIVETWQGAPAKLQDYLGTCGDRCGDRWTETTYDITVQYTLPYRLRGSECSVHAKNYLFRVG